jgi:excisionase family DNA binding protein
MSADETTLTIEEAAARLGVSVATARRMAAAGQIPARKSGKQWIVDGTGLSSVRPRRRVSSSSTLDIDRALGHVRRTDLTEVWVPDILHQADRLADAGTVLAGARARFEGRPIGTAIEIEIDKTDIFTRWATLLDVEDRVAYQAAVASFADRVDGQTPDSVFSARLSSDGKYFLKHGPRQWVRWRRYVRGLLDGAQQWMVSTDLTAYFDTVSHHLLIAEVESLNVDRAIVATLSDMLRTWTAVPGQGLPQGPNASRILANLYMLPIDRAMLEYGWTYSRYMDDVRIITSTKADAVKALRQFQRECRTRGLIVSGTKTDLLFGDEARKSLEIESDLAAADYLMLAHGSELARSELKAVLKRALRSKVRVDERRARFSLWRLAQLREGAVLGQVLKRLEDLAPLASVVAAYLRPFVSRKRVVDSLAAFLADPARSYSPHLATWLFAVMLEHPGTLPSTWAEQAARRVKDRNEPPFLRAPAAVVMARGSRAADIRWIKDDIRKEHDPAVLRGYTVALHWVHALDKTTQRQLVARSHSLSATIEYLQGRVVLPSLVYKSTHLKVQA